MSDQSLFKTTIHPRIYIHWVLITITVFIVAPKFPVNPAGISILICLLLLTLIVHPVTTIVLTESEIKIAKTYGFLYVKNNVIRMDGLKEIHQTRLGTDLGSEGGLLTGNFIWSVLIGLLTGVFFYQSTAELTFYQNEKEPTVSIGVNVPEKQLTNFLSFCEAHFDVKTIKVPKEKRQWV